MLQQILIRTPFYVWLILAGLLYRGYLSSKDREVDLWKLFLIPALMPLLTIPDLAIKFGQLGTTFAIWAMAAVVTAVLTWQCSSPKVTLAAQPGKVLVRGSWLPLAAMMLVFFTKYALNIMLAVSPQARHDSVFAAVVCSLLGLFNGLFFGWLARDTTAWLQTRSRGTNLAVN